MAPNLRKVQHRSGSAHRPTMLTLSDHAVKHLQHILAERSTEEGLGLRLDVEKGGCAGYQYVMQVTHPQDDDSVIEAQGLRIFVSTRGKDILSGCHLDYSDSLNDSGFKIENPNAERSCGCGTSFEPRTGS